MAIRKGIDSAIVDVWKREFSNRSVRGSYLSQYCLCLGYCARRAAKLCHWFHRLS
ncbi:hypothetical protein CASFOL_018079 [Castilleja foliolosa]|uniref:Uncharacterized protein n=1 Tax=Castilleja foliolosa TaxID=1961234 RepID=A0ABD3DAT1_9LAMI